MEAAIGIEQLKKLPRLVTERQALAARLTQGLRDLKGLRTPVVKQDCSHVYYVYPMVLDAAATGVPRERIIAALVAEGVSVAGGYCNLHLLPMYQKRMAYGSKGFPWSGGLYRGKVSYAKGICPAAESLNDERFLCIGLCQYAYTAEDIDLIAEAFRKVWLNLDRLTAA